MLVLIIFHALITYIIECMTVLQDAYNAEHMLEFMDKDLTLSMRQADGLRQIQRSSMDSFSYKAMVMASNYQI